MKHKKKAKKRGEGSAGTKSVEKRVFSQIGDLSELSCKKKQVVWEDEVLILPMAEVGNQHCQES